MVRQKEVGIIKKEGKNGIGKIKRYLVENCDFYRRVGCIEIILRFGTTT